MADDTANPLNVPYGYCHCGCGQKTKIAQRSVPKQGIRRGDPYHFLVGHSHRKGGEGRYQARFFQRIDRDAPNGCWEWLGSQDDRGYGKLWVSGKNVFVHRLSYQWFVGDIPDGMFVCHRCDNPICCNPEHLFLGTALENNRDCINKGRAIKIRGEQNGNTHLTNEDIRLIRRLYAQGMLQREIGAKFGIGQTTVSLIVLRQRWRHVED